MVRELVGAHFGLGASLKDVQKLSAETLQLGKANPVERNEHQPRPIKGWRGAGERVVGAPGLQKTSPAGS